MIYSFAFVTEYSEIFSLTHPYQRYEINECSSLPQLLPDRFRRSNLMPCNEKHSEKFYWLPDLMFEYSISYLNNIPQ